MLVYVNISQNTTRPSSTRLNKAGTILHPTSSKDSTTRRRVISACAAPHKRVTQIYFLANGIRGLFSCLQNLTVFITIGEICTHFWRIKLITNQVYSESPQIPRAMNNFQLQWTLGLLQEWLTCVLRESKGRHSWEWNGNLRKKDLRDSRRSWMQNRSLRSWPRYLENLWG